MVRTSVAKGIFQSDVIIRSALIRALDDIRDNPWLLDFIFASLLHDEVTREEYGEKNLEEAKSWFLKTDVPVSMSYRHDQPVSPLIAVSLEDSSENGANSLGDVHSTPTEMVDASEIVVKNPTLTFTPAAYEPATGTVTLPDGLTTEQVHVGMVLVSTREGKDFPIREVVDAHSFRIEPGVRADFFRAQVAPPEHIYVVNLESVEERETYRIDVFVAGNPVHLLYLWAIVKFALYRYKQELLEARGFERSTVSSMSLRLLRGTSDAETLYARTFMVSGWVRQSWPKSVRPRVMGLSTQITFSDEANTSTSPADQSTQGWDVESDEFDGIG
jgi:hypothetical protein